MPHSKQAKKRHRQSVKRAARNTWRLERVKELTKQIRTLAAAGKTADAAKLLPDLYQALDKAAKKHIIHKNAAARKKSRLTMLINKSGGPATTGKAPAKKAAAKKVRKTTGEK